MQSDVWHVGVCLWPSPVTCCKWGRWWGGGRSWDHSNWVSSVLLAGGKFCRPVPWHHHALCRWKELLDCPLPCAGRLRSHRKFERVIERAKGKGQEWDLLIITEHIPYGRHWVEHSFHLSFSFNHPNNSVNPAWFVLFFFPLHRWGNGGFKKQSAGERQQGWEWAEFSPRPVSGSHQILEALDQFHLLGVSLWTSGGSRWLGGGMALLGKKHPCREDQLSVAIKILCYKTLQKWLDE